MNILSETAPWIGLAFFSLPLLASLYWFYVKKNSSIGLSLLILTGFILRLYMISLDPFLHDWDEKFHALVAKNMMQQPFRPMLFKDRLQPYQIEAWCCNHIKLITPIFTNLLISPTNIKAE